MRRLVWWVLATAALAALVVLGLSKIDLHQVGRSLAHVRAGWIAVAAGLMTATFLARAESWFAAIRAALGDSVVDRLTVTRVLLIGMFGSSVAPGRLGEAARAWLIARHTGQARRTLAAVIGTLLSQTFLNLIALLILAAVALAGGAIPGAHAGAVAAVAAVPAGVLLVLMLGPKLVSSSVAVRRGPVGRVAGWVSQQLGEVGRGLAVFRRLRTLLHSVSFQMLGWTLQAGACYAVILAFGFENRAGLASAAAILFAVNVTAAVPITPANVGVFQAACIGVLAPLGIRAGTGLAYGLVLQAVELGCAMALGVPSLLGEGLSVAELRRTAPVGEVESVPQANGSAGDEAHGAAAQEGDGAIADERPAGHPA